MKVKQNGHLRGRGVKGCAAATAIALSLTATAETKPPLPAAVVEALNLALADERHALATYQAVLERFGEVRPFVNIAQAEQRHIDALLGIYAHYGVPVPPDEPQADSATRSLDLVGLCQIGVAAEIENVRLYDEQLLPTVEAHPDISSVLRALRDASANNHLPAFERCASRGRGQGHHRN